MNTSRFEQHKSNVGKRVTRLAGLVVCLLFAALVNAGVAVPQIAPAPAGTHGFPFGSSSLDLEKFGYVEEEFFLSGNAVAYANTGPLENDGKWNVAPVAGAVAPYQTRIMVRRPANPRRFNGTVVVEWLNVSGGIDATPDWAFLSGELMREGYAYVAVSAQFIGATFLTTWETGEDARYASISHPGDSFSYSIFSQAGMAVRSPDSGNPKPLGQLTKRIRAVIATGHSQSGSRMLTYANAVQPQDLVYDGILIRGPFGASAISQSSAGGFLGGGSIPAPPGVPATADIPAPSLPMIRDDLNQPLILVNSETELNVPITALSVHQQPDSELIRIWEVTGAAHADQTQLTSLRADATKSLGATPERDCGPLPINDGAAHGQVVRAAVSALQRWLRFGIQAPVAPRVQMNMAVFPPTIVRDPATGLAVGGIRLPEIVAPTRTLSGVRPIGIVANDQNCFLFGGVDPWNGDTDSYDGLGYDISPTPEPNLLMRYPSHRDYVSAVIHSSLESMFDGFLRPVDAFDSVYKAAASPIPQ